MKRLAASLLIAFLSVSVGVRAEEKHGLGYQDTPIIPGTNWHVHDGTRPQPAVVTPGTFSTPETPGKPPSDAIVLFDGTDLSKCKAKSGGGESKWKCDNGCMYPVPNCGYNVTKDEFGDCQLHLEFSEPTPPKGDSQGRGNSGVFFFGRYELQVLDSFNNPTYPDGQASAIYGQSPPLLNPARPPGEWQTYDVVFIAPRFKDGKLDTPAYITVFYNGVLVHNKKEILGSTGHRIAPKYSPHGEKGSIELQDHGNPVRFRNIWIRNLKDYDQPEK